MRDIVMIKTENLRHHPKNPRQEIGDITELAASVKENGIMQNLTVIVAHDETYDYNGANKVGDDRLDELIASEYTHYYVLIGNRRMEAAKEAGLEEVPCVVRGRMSLADQVAIMMQENMQREDLTIIEEAFGFQMMLDLGDNIMNVARKTGFSDATVRSRVKIAELDRDILQKKYDDGNFQLTLTDLCELNKIEDVKERNKILDKATSENDLKWKVERAVAAQKRAADEEKLIGIFNEKGITHINELDGWSAPGWDVIRCESASSLLEGDDPVEWDEVESYGIYKSSINYYVLAKRKSEDEPEEENKPTRDPIREELKEISDRVEDICKSVREDMKEFTHKVLIGIIKPLDERLKQNPIETLWEYARTEGIDLDSIPYALDDFGLFESIHRDLGDDEEAMEIAVDGQIRTNIPIAAQLLGTTIYSKIRYGGSVLAWNYKRQEHSMARYAEAYNILHMYGYEYESDEIRDILRGRGELWRRVDELIEERDKAAGATN